MIVYVLATAICLAIHIYNAKLIDATWAELLPWLILSFAPVFNVLMAIIGIFLVIRYGNIKFLKQKVFNKNV